jgi:hypothetical protein
LSEFKILAQDVRANIRRYVVFHETESLDEIKRFVSEYRRRFRGHMFIYFWNDPNLVPDYLPGGPNSLLWSEEAANAQLASYCVNPHTRHNRLVFKGEDMGAIE